MSNIISKITSVLSKVDGREVKHSFKESGKYLLKINNETIELLPEHVIFSYIPKNKSGIIVKTGEVDGRAFAVILHTEITPELKLEGIAREIVHTVSGLRKKLNLSLSDRIRLSVSGAEEVIEIHREYIEKETLSEIVENIDTTTEIEINGLQINIGIELWQH